MYHKIFQYNKIKDHEGNFIYTFYANYKVKIHTLSHLFDNLKQFTLTKRAFKIVAT